MIVVICGLPGVGKTTLTKDLAPLIHAQILSSDKIRKELFPKPTYSKKEKDLVYEVLILTAKYLHASGKNCILDATFNKESIRVKLKKKLSIPKNQIHFIECVCPEHLVISRLKKRIDDYSDADYSIYKKLKRKYEPLKISHSTIDTSKNRKTSAKIAALKILKNEP